MDQLLADVRYSLRLLRKAPVFTMVAVATLALGIGANTTLFTLIDAVLVRPLPYADPDRVVMLWEDVSAAGFPKNTPAPANYADWRRLNRSFVDVAATIPNTASLTGDGAPEQVVGRGVSANFFAVLGVPPFLGRTFTEEEDRAGAPVVLISHRLWQRRYASDPAIVGRTILMNDARVEIIGVLPPPFVFRFREMDYWVPMHLPPAAAAERNSHYLNVVARLKPGVTLEAASADMQAIAQRLQQQYPLSNRNVGAVVVPMKEEVLGNTRVELIVLMAAAAAILLIACANLASLLLTRAADRRREMAIRAALGAGSARLIGQMVIEGLVLSLVGGAIGLAFAPSALTLLMRLVPVGLLPDAVALDSRLLAFAFGLSVATGLLFSIVPALHGARASVQASLQGSGRASVGAGSRSLRDVLVVLQVSAALVLLAGAGLLLRTFANLRAIDVGFRSNGLLTLRTSLPRPKYAEPQKRQDFYARVIAQVQALPGVQEAAYASTLPFQSQGNTRGFRIEGREPKPGEIDDALYRVATGRYLRMLGVELIEGRLIDERDGADAPPVVVINETFKRQFWANASPLGQRLGFGPNTPRRTIVGVVKDVRERGYDIAMKPGVYLPSAQTPETLLDFLVVRAAGDPLALSAQVQRVVNSVDPSQPIANVRTLDDIVELTVADRRQQMVLLVAFAGLALMLAALGLYGMLAYLVAGRRREIGLRMALGATRQSVVAMVVGRGVGLTAAGMIIGFGIAWGVTRVLNTLLYGVGATDPLTFGAVVALLGLVALAASTLPAFQASRVDPMVVLRDQ